MTNPECPDCAKNAQTESEKCEHWKHGYYRPGGPEDGLYCRRCQTPVSDEYTTLNQPGEHTTSPSEFPLEDLQTYKLDEKGFKNMDSTGRTIILLNQLAVAINSIHSYLRGRHQNG